MSNKGEKRGWVPKLRFPEFREAGAWERKPLAPHLVDCSGRVPPDTNLPIYSSTREGLRPQDTYFGGRVLQNKNEYGIVPPNCLVYRHMSDDGLFKFNINQTGGNIAVSKEYPVFKTRDLNPLFLIAKLNEGLDFKRFAQAQKAGGTRTRLYFSKLCELQSLLPSLAEQQKIADCLTSLDELIALEGQKLDALKTHKQGLMQQLFPAEGETLPKLRFPEFRDAGAWEIVPLGSLLMRNPEYGLNAPAVSYSHDLPTYLRITDISEDGCFLSESKVSVDITPTDENYLESGDIVLARTGASVGKSYRYRVEDGRLVFAGFLIRIRPKQKRANATFLANFFTTQQYWSWVGVISARSGQPGINGTEYSSLPVPVPSNEDNGLSEQQKIADCLSSLDDLITAQIQKLAVLRTHKKGLMQQLFPVLDEVFV